MPYLSDDFNRPDAPTLGVNWYETTYVGGTSFADWSIKSNTAVLATVARTERALYRTVVPSNNYEVSAEIENTLGINGIAGVIARAPSLTPLNDYLQGYVGCIRRVNPPPPGVTGIYQLMVYGLLGFAVAGIGAFCTLPTNGIIKLRISGNTLTLYHNGINVLQYVDGPNLWPTAGYAGIFGYSFFTVLGGTKSDFDWWNVGPISAGEKPVYLVGDDAGNIYPTVVNNTAAVPGVTEGDDGIITVVAPRTVTDLGDGVLLVE